MKNPVPVKEGISLGEGGVRAVANGAEVEDATVYLWATNTAARRWPSMSSGRDSFEATKSLL